MDVVSEVIWKPSFPNNSWRKEETITLLDIIHYFLKSDVLNTRKNIFRISNWMKYILQEFLNTFMFYNLRIIGEIKQVGTTIYFQILADIVS